MIEETDAKQLDDIVVQEATLIEEEIAEIILEEMPPEIDVLIFI